MFGNKPFQLRLENIWERESRAIVKTAPEDYVEVSVGHSLQEQLGLPRRATSQLCRVVGGVGKQSLKDPGNTMNDQVRNHICPLP